MSVNRKPTPRRPLFLTVAVVGLFGLAAAACSGDQNDATTTTAASTVPADSTTPLVDRTVWQTGLANPWDLAFLPDSTALITERGGRVRANFVRGRSS